jgi:protein TonB
VRAYASSVSKVLDRQKPRSRGVKGLVRIQFTVDAGGRPSAPLVLASSGSPRLDDMVIEAVSRMKFPAPPPQMSPRQRTFTVPFAFR